MYFNSDHRWKLVRDAKCQSLHQRKAAGILPFENVPPEIVKSPDPSEEPVAGAANQDFPDNEPIWGEDSDEDNMLSLEDPYPCRFGSGASLSMRTRECEECKRGAVL